MTKFKAVNSKSLTGFVQTMKKFDELTAKKLDLTNKIVISVGKQMLEEFRAHQVSPSPDRKEKGVKDDADKISAAKAYVTAHSGGTPKTTMGSPWTNRSSFAKRGVHYYVRNTDEEIVCGLMHTMSYGAYLEFANNRQHAVIEPIVRSYAPYLIDRIAEVWS